MARSKVDPKYDAQLLALAEKAKSIDGYVIEVNGYASTSENCLTPPDIVREAISRHLH